MPGYVGRKFALQGDLDPMLTCEAVLELVVAHLRKSFLKEEPLIEHLREVVKKYDHFVTEGMDATLDEDENNGDDTPTSDDVKKEAPNNVEFEPATAELSDN